jgi:hypothetical protein
MFVGFQCLLYRKAFSDFPSKQSDMACPSLNVNVAESLIGGFTPLKCPVFRVFWSLLAGSLVIGGFLIIVRCLAKLINLFILLKGKMVKM